MPLMLSMQSKVVLFDFCGTLIRFQTADRYVRFCLDHMSSVRSRWRCLLLNCMDKIKFFKLINRLMPVNNLRKRMVLWQIEGMPLEYLDRMAELYLTEELLPNMVQPVVKLMQQHISDGDAVWIVSGGYDIYISKFAKHFGVPHVMATRIGFRNAICTGKMDGPDCMRENKCFYWAQSGVKDDADVTFYTDSVSDLPLLKKVRHGVIVSHGKSQLWAKENNYKEIIWS